MVLVFGAFLSLDAHRSLLSQEATTQIKSGDLELQTSRVYVRVGKVGLGHEHGASCKLKSGSLHLSQPDASGSHGKLVFDMTSFEADSDAARKYVGLEGSTEEATRKQVNENLLGRDVLDVEKYETATFEAKRITKLDELSKRGLPKYKFEGDFTLHGTTKPLEFAADVEVVKGWNHLRGGFAILQSAYGIKPYSKMLGAVGVTDRLLIYGDLIVAP
jgi:polyisoprenoid-binding protein YceI